MSSVINKSDKNTAKKPDHYNHRQRLRQQVLKGHVEALADYQLLEMLLFAVFTRQDTKPLAKKLLSKFGSLGAVLSASKKDIASIAGAGESVAALLIALNNTVKRVRYEKIIGRHFIASQEAMLDYCYNVMALKDIEMFCMICLNKNMEVISHITLQEGTVSRVCIYPRQVIQQALDANAASVVLLHNHPSGNVEPSLQDIQYTHEVQRALTNVEIELIDHLIIGNNKHFSMRRKQLLLGPNNKLCFSKSAPRRKTS